MNEFKLRRLRMLMEPEPGNPLEVEGVLNPAAAGRFGTALGSEIDYERWPDGCSRCGGLRRSEGI
jgi:hypothetical protein